MYTREQAKQEILKSLKKAVGKGFECTVEDLVDADLRFGDIAFPVFELAKKQKKNPVELAKEIAANIKATDLIESVEATGPYLNFRFNNTAFIKNVLSEIKKLGTKFGEGDLGKGTSLMIEYAQPNTLKEFHVGHIRSSVYGQSVVNVARINGYKVTATSYINDLGANVAKILWWMKKNYSEQKVEKENHNSFMQKVYVEATENAENDEARTEISETFEKLENQEKGWFELWKETRQWSLDSFKEYFEELNVRPDVTYYESEVLQDGKKIVKKLLTDGIAKKSQGAVIVDLEDEGLGVMLLLKSDGTSLYSTRDLPLAFKKDKDYDADRQLFVVDVRQSLYFKQLFATLKKMGFTKQLTHLAFDFVNLPDGAMSSRKGNIVTYEDLRDDMVEFLEHETKTRHEDWSEKKIKSTAKTLAIASMNFMMLRQDPESIITFDIKEAMSFDGFTGPYILYTIARIESIKKKAKTKAKIDETKLDKELELELARQVAIYPELVQRVGKSFKVSSIATWAFDTAKLFNEYYHEVKILDDEDKERLASRLALIEAVRHSLENAMSILCIDVLKEM